MTDSTDKDQKPWLFKPGQSGNPKGRPKGSRQLLQEDFLKDVYAAWQDKGAAAVDAMIADKPGDFVKMVAGILPKEMSLKVNELDDLTDEQLARQLASLATQLARAGLAIDAGVEAQEGAEQASGVSTIQ